MKTALVLGAGGFIGGHMVTRLKSDGFWVRGVDLEPHGFVGSQADEFVTGDLTDQKSATINLNIVKFCQRRGAENVFFSSSACVYAQEHQMDPDNPNCAEQSAYPANPDTEYGWEKLFSERLFLSYNKQYGINCKVAGYHNIFGPFGAWRGGREKAPAAICRKVAKAPDGGSIEIWGDGTQTRSFLFIEEAIEASTRLMRSDFRGPVNIGSEEMISINNLARMVIDISGKSLVIDNVKGPEGVRGRNSDNTLILEQLNWAPSASLRTGIEKTYHWIQDQLTQQPKPD
jgi:nucleoside-diphosphate-sugar epimerase